MKTDAHAPPSPGISAFSKANLAPYLERLLGGRVEILAIGPLGGGDVKGYGYGVPLKVDLRCAGRARSLVLETVRPGPYGHEHFSDRAQGLLWARGAFNELPRHVRALDVGAVRRDGPPLSAGSAEEFFLVTEFAAGRPYADDLLRLGEAGPGDLARADALCAWLADVHRVRGTEPGLYARRWRELLGHGECVMGLTDDNPLDDDLLRDIEDRVNAFRWRWKGRSDRLRRVHGDFHPWNLLFREGEDFSVLDRSRGEWGEAADDVACLTMNYLFFSLRAHGRLAGGYETLWRRFWDGYLARTGDVEILELVAPFFAFRGLVMAHPLWYPALEAGVRRRIVNFILRVLDEARFDPALANAYCGG